MFMMSISHGSTGSGDLITSRLFADILIMAIGVEVLTALKFRLQVVIITSIQNRKPLIR
jgi:hypothetical protein